MGKTVLVIEDESSIQNILKNFLESKGYNVVLAGNGFEGCSLAKECNPDLLILDIMLPGIDGYEVCKRIRSESSIPIIMLSALDEEENQIKGFDLEADDYITKPFSMSLLLKRVEAQLRRRSMSESESKTIIYKDISIDLSAYTVQKNGAPVALTTLEFELLSLLLTNQGRVFSRDSIINQLWGYDFYGDASIVNTHIKNIRKKLGTNIIETVRGVGYRIDKENQ